MLRGSHGDVAGAESGASSAERSTGQHGNHPWSAQGPRGQRGASGWVHRRPSGPGWGGAVVVGAGVTTCHGVRESRSQGEGRQRSRGGMETAIAKDAPVNAGAPPQRPQGCGGGYRRCRPTFTVGHHAHTAGIVESPVRREAHAGFGERPGETDQQQCRHRAPGRLNPVDAPQPGTDAAHCGHVHALGVRESRLLTPASAGSAAGRPRPLLPDVVLDAAELRLGDLRVGAGEPDEANADR